MISLTHITQRKWVNACVRLRLQVDKKKGKGSHYRVTNPANGKITILPSHCHKYINLGVYKTLLQWGFTEEEIDGAIK